MAQPRTIHLSTQQEQELTWVRDHHEKAYLRERAAAILKVAAGRSMVQVSLHGLYKPRQYETISRWITRYEQEGLAGATGASRTRAQARFFPLQVSTRNWGELT